MPLYLVSTPIGNLEDITLRALRILREADLIACEDTRHTRRLLDRHGITTATISYHEHNERARAVELAERLVAGQSVAIVTDAGTPGISDPAYRLVRLAIDRAIAVVPIPGVSAHLAALVASGLPTDTFTFAGFLPPRRQARRERLADLRRQRTTLIIYEAPHRIRETLADALEVLGDCQAVVARELTKLHEEFLRGSISSLITHFEACPPRGEMTLVLSGWPVDNDKPASELSLADEVRMLIEEISVDATAASPRGEPVKQKWKEALKQVARRRNIPRREAYRQYLAATTNDQEAGLNEEYPQDGQDAEDVEGVEITEDV